MFFCLYLDVCWGISGFFFLLFLSCFFCRYFFISLFLSFSLLVRDIYRVLVLSVDDGDRRGPGYFLDWSFCSHGSR